MTREEKLPVKACLICTIGKHRNKKNIINTIYKGDEFSSSLRPLDTVHACYEQ
jgi:hypothetical protein